MNILIIGSGGREHALVWKIKQSPLVETIWCAPGNAGIAQECECLPLTAQAEILAFCLSKQVSLVVVGPEQPLVEGLADELRANSILVFGPNEKAAQLEGSKGFTKDLCRKYNIPTAVYERFTALEPALGYLKKYGAPIVIKADGLAAGKGVVVAMRAAEAETAVREMFEGGFGDAGESIVIEEFLEGEEVSFFALCDGAHTMPFAAAQDHKRVGEKDTGPNTGGMGTYAPLPIFTEALRDRTMQEIIEPTLHAMAGEGMPYQGVLFAGLMLTKDGPKLIEYNARFGDPETQSMLMLLESDLVPLLMACANGTLADADAPVFYEGAAMCVVMAANGYPGPYEKGTQIRNLEVVGNLPGVKIFHAGTAEKNGQIIATGGRVLGVTARGDTLAEAKTRAYAAVGSIDWPEGFCRHDIGWRAL